MIKVASVESPRTYPNKTRMAHKPANSLNLNYGNNMNLLIHTNNYANKVNYSRHAKSQSFKANPVNILVSSPSVPQISSTSRKIAKCMGVVGLFGSSIRDEYGKLIDEKEVMENSLDFNSRFKTKFNPKNMNEITSTLTDKAIHLTDQYRLNGTLAATTDINDNTIISTDCVLSCAVATIVDKTNNLQSLIHCHALYSSSDIDEVLRYLLSHSLNSKDLEISLIPGCQATTDFTVTGVDHILKSIITDYKISPKINYLNFPENVKRDRNTAIVLKNGEVSFCNTYLIENKIINPLNEIVYFENA